MRTTRRLRAVAASAAVTAAGVLAGCGGTPAQEPPEGPIVLRSAASSGTPSPSATPTTSSGVGAAPLAPDVRDHDADVDVRDQTGDGRTVVVEEVVVTVGPGHVVVVDPSGGAVLGTAAVRAGTTRALTVTLATPLPRSGEYLVLLHADDGDGRYDEARDGLVVHAGGDDGPDGDDDDSGADRAVDEDFRYTLR